MDKKEEMLVSEANAPEQANDAPATPTIPVGNDQTLEQLKELIKVTVTEVIAASKTEESRKQIEEYNSKVSELVSNTQAKIVKPNLGDNQSHLEYVNKVLKEDARQRLQSSDGRVRYGEDPESLTKAKIILLKKMGLNENEIAMEIKDLL